MTEVVQVRLPEGLVNQIDRLVDTKIYSTRSDVVREAVRSFFWEDIIGIIPDKGDSVKEIRKIRNKLSKEIKSFKDIEKLNRLDD